MAKIYILVDYENVQPRTLDVLKGHDLRVIVFVGANQAKIPFELAVALQEFGENAEYVKISGNGPNALDFHIAYYIGQLASQDPTGRFYIISKDSGFDPLMRHLKEKRIQVWRRKAVTEIPIGSVSSTASPDERVKAVVKRLTALGQCRPRKVKTLANTINALFLKTLDGDALSALIAELKRRKLIAVDGEKISYHLPG